MCNYNTLQQRSNKFFVLHSLELLELTIRKMYVFLCTLLYVSSYLLQRNVYLPVKYTARIVDYLTAKYPLVELTHA